jgi:tRNA-(ms[2]io[6]A)-hydroxylase
MPKVVDLPLLCKTSDDWAEQALKYPLALLNDHAHLERKAATNALDLLPRWPQVSPPHKWVAIMTSIAKDEVEHLGIVSRILEKRGGKMTKHHDTPYAQALRKLVRLGLADKELIDRLMISALIEARSCERFEILSRVCTDLELKKLYKALWASEHGHFRLFLDVAKRVRPAPEVEKRWQEMLEAESKIIQAQDGGSRMHSWVS